VDLPLAHQLSRDFPGMPGVNVITPYNQEPDLISFKVDCGYFSFEQGSLSFRED
jgi:hypothetical protein